MFNAYYEFTCIFEIWAGNLLISGIQAAGDNRKTDNTDLIPMDKNFNELISYSEAGILSKVIVKNDKMNITLFCMAAGTEISGHTSTKQGFVYVIEGDGLFYLEGQEIVMSAGRFIYMDANAVHSLKASENTSFILVLANN